MGLYSEGAHKLATYFFLLPVARFRDEGFHFTLASASLLSVMASALGVTLT